MDKSCNEYTTQLLFTFTCLLSTSLFSRIIMADHTFNHAERGKYTLEEKDALGKMCEKYKLEYDEKLNMGLFYINSPPPC